jgi:Holliday junction resolvase RusA-like endonuclease
MSAAPASSSDGRALAAEQVAFTVAGAPLGWERVSPRAVTRKDGTQFATLYTPTRTRQAQAHVKLEAGQAMRGRAPFTCTVEMILTAVFPIPRSFSQKKRRAALAFELLPGVKPDLDNIEKLALDAMNGVVFRDDVLVCRVSKAKVYGEVPRLIVTVRPFPLQR